MQLCGRRLVWKLAGEFKVSGAPSKGTSVSHLGERAKPSGVLVSKSSEVNDKTGKNNKLYLVM